MPSSKDWVKRPSSLIKRGCGVQALKVRLQNCLFKGSKRFARVIICNLSK